MIVCTLKQILDRKGWSRYRLQKQSGISYPTIHALYHNRSTRYSAKVLDKLCRTLVCGLEEILKFEPKRFSRLRKGK
jgi:DNA-binding Xre family transcriptional regulator